MTAGQHPGEVPQATPPLAAAETAAVELAIGTVALSDEPRPREYRGMLKTKAQQVRIGRGLLSVLTRISG